MANRETQIAAEVVRTGTSNTIATQITVEAVKAGNPNAVATQIALEVVILNPASVKSPVIPIQSGTGGTSSQGGSHSVTMPQTMIAGRRVVIMTCLTNTARTVGSVVDDAAGGSSTYFFKGAINQSTNVRIECWLCDNVKAAQNITITLSSGTSIQCSSVTEFANSLGFGNFNTNTAAGTQAPSIALTVQRAYSMVVGGFVTPDGPVVAQGLAKLLITYDQGTVASSSQSELVSLFVGQSITTDVAIGASDNVAMAAIELFPGFASSFGAGPGGANISGGRQRGPRSEFIG